MSWLYRSRETVYWRFKVQCCEHCVETITTVTVLEICVINAFVFGTGFSKGYLILEVPNMKAIILQGYYAA